MAQEEAEDFYGEERAAWYRLTPMQRMARSAVLWQFYLGAAGSLDSCPDSQSPFFYANELREGSIVRV